MDEVSMKDILEAWNGGFSDYQVNIQMTADLFLSRMVQEKLSMEYSFVYYSEDKPVGVIVNGISQRGKEKLSWNGGTAIHPDFRGRGIGKKLVEATLRVYEENEVQVATLEAISNNENAIRLYEHLGYEIADKISMLVCSEPIAQIESSSIMMKEEPIEKVMRLPFFTMDIPWQNQVHQPGAFKGSIFYSDGEPTGYAIYKLQRGLEGELTQLILYQLELKYDVGDREKHFRDMMTKLLEGDTSIKKVAINQKHKSGFFHLYNELGFKEFVQQVWMKKKIKEV